MSHKISILIRADVGRDAIEIYISGCLTEDTRHVLAPQIVKAGTLDPSAPILVDLTQAQHVDSTALDLLRSTVEAKWKADGYHHASLQLQLPSEAPTCPLGEVALAGQP